MERIRFIIALILIVIGVNLYATEKCKGPVFKCVTKEYDAKNVFGETQKGDLTVEKTEWFDEYRNLIKKEVSDSKGEAKTEYKYNTNNLVFEERSFIGGLLEKYMIYEYRGSQQTSVKTYSASNELLSMEKTEYLSNNNRIVEIYDEQGKRISRNIDKYDARGNALEKGGMVYKYNSKNQVIHLNATLVLIPLDIYCTYNAKGDVETCRTVCTDLMYTTTQTYNYQYDFYGNWTIRAEEKQEKQAMESKENHTLTERFFTYAKDKNDYRKLKEQEEEEEEKLLVAKRLIETQKQRVLDEARIIEKQKEKERNKRMQLSIERELIDHLKRLLAEYKGNDSSYPSDLKSIILSYVGSNSKQSQMFSESGSQNKYKLEIKKQTLIFHLSSKRCIYFDLQVIKKIELGTYNAWYCEGGIASGNGDERDMGVLLCLEGEFYLFEKMDDYKHVTLDMKNQKMEELQEELYYLLTLDDRKKLLASNEFYSTLDLETPNGFFLALSKKAQLTSADYTKDFQMPSFRSYKISIKDTKKLHEIGVKFPVSYEVNPVNQSETPEFQGGTIALMRFIANSINYPAVAKMNGIQGRVIIQFVVNIDGRIAKPKVVKGVDPYLDKEALRIISTMPKWKPAMRGGKAVPAEFTVPVMFRLQ